MKRASPQHELQGDDDVIYLGVDSSEGELSSSDDEGPKQHTLPTDTSSGPGVIYLGRIPHGFYENEMRAYFAQFGTVTRLRLSRNKKTGHSKHYAFVEFASAQVAEIVAESMNNYLLYNHILKCSVIPPEKVHAELFKGANRTFKVVPYQKLAREQHNGPKTAEQVRKQQERLVEQENKKRQKLKEMGVDYTFQGYAAQLPATAQHVRYSDE